MLERTHICFDLDGTLINSVPLMKDSWENVSTTLNLKIGWDAYKKNIGLHFSEICENLGLKDVEDKVSDLYFGYNKANIDRIELCPNVKEALALIEARNISWSIITSKPRQTTTGILERFNFNPDALVCSDDVSKGKPNPEAAQVLKSRLEVADDTDFIYVGDTVSDFIFAINSGFHFIRFDPPSPYGGPAGSGDDLDAFRHVLNPCRAFSDMQELVSEIIGGA